MGGIARVANSFPGYDSVIPAESATVAKILKEHGYSTSCFGKWHLTPTWRKGLLDLLTGGPPAWALIDFTILVVRLHSGSHV